MKATPYPVYYASLSTLPGCAIQLGGVTYFAAIDDDHIHVIPDQAALLITGQIQEPMAEFVRGELARKLYAQTPTRG